MLPLCFTNTKSKRAPIFNSAEFMILQHVCSWRYLEQLAASAGTLLTSEELPMGVASYSASYKIGRRSQRGEMECASKMDGLKLTQGSAVQY